MLKRNLFSTVAGVLSLLASVALPARAQNRLPQAIPVASARVTVPNTVSREVKLSTDLGVANPDQALSLSIRFNMTPAKTLALQQLLASQQNPSSPLYHQWLTPQQFGAEFGLSTTDLATVSNWLGAQGFTVTGIANGRSFISFTGTVAQAEQAFQTSIHRVSFNGEQHLANVTDSALPAAIAQVATGITGLNDFRVKPRVHRHAIVASPDLAAAKYDAAGGYGHLLAPGDFYTIYDENKLLTPSTGTPINGTGVTIAVLGQVDVYPADVSSFRTAAGLSTNAFTQNSVTTTPAAPTAAQCGASNAPSSCDDLYESSLDLEWSGASAPGANILFVTGQDIFADSMTQAIDKNLAPILTISYGECEQFFNSGVPTTQTLDALFMQANAQGQTVLGPSGDSGATDCDGGQGETYATLGLAVDYPASSPYVTAVGGTQFDDANGTYWNATNGANGGSAIGYIPEQPWDEFFQTYNGALAGLLDGGGGGGGVSSFYSKPYWQQGPGVPADASRDVPDVAYAAAANHDGYLFCALGSCTNGGFGTTTAGATTYDAAGGTSFATPIFAGTLALVEQQVGGKLGNANPTIYGLANSTYLATVFHDKDSGGSNAAPCTEGTPGCDPNFPNFYAAGTLACPANSCSGNTSYPAIGYKAGSGYVYDTATGWGSVDVANLVADWALVAPIAATITSSNHASAVIVSTSTPSITAGGTISVTAVVSSASSGTSTTPSGQATLLVDGVAEGTPVLLSGGTATLSYTTTVAAASGTHTVSVSYGGDTLYAGSVGAVSVDVTAAPGQGQDFSLTPVVSSVTVASGGTTTPLTYTVTSINGFSGSVAFTASTSSNTLNNDAAVSFSSQIPITVTTTTPGTITFTLYAYYNATTGLFKQDKVKRLGVHGLANNSTVHNPWALAGSGVALAGLLLFGLPRRRRNRWSALLLAAFSVAVLSVAGCTGPSGSGSGSTGNNGNTNVPAGTYPVTITATGTTAAGVTFSHSADITLTVQ